MIFSKLTLVTVLGEMVLPEPITPADPLASTKKALNRSSKTFEAIVSGSRIESTGLGAKNGDQAISSLRGSVSHSAKVTRGIRSVGANGKSTNKSEKDFGRQSERKDGKTADLGILSCGPGEYGLRTSNDRTSGRCVPVDKQISVRGRLFMLSTNLLIGNMQI